MIWTITKKEFYQHVISFRFTVCFVLALILTAISIDFRSLDYTARLRNHTTAVNNSQNELKNIEALSFLQPKIHRPPHPGSIFVEGAAEKLGTDVTVNHHHIPVEASGGGAINQFATIFRSLDFPNVVIILLSLLALLISYDSISGEKERGLLALSLSNAIPRHHILLGKYLGGLLLLGYSMTVGLLAGILISLITSGTPFEWESVLRIVLIFLTSCLFLSFMLILGIVVSSLTHRSFITLIHLLFLWVLFVFIIPRLANYSSQQLRRVKSKREVNNQITQLNMEMGQKVSEYRKTIRPQRSWASMENRGEKGFMLTVHGNPPETVEHFRRLFAYTGPLQLEYAQLFWNMEKRRLDDLEKQRKLTAILTAISPVALYQQSMTMLTGTDRANYDKFMSAAQQFRQQIIDYVEAQGGFSSDRYFMQYDFNPDPIETNLYSRLSTDVNLIQQPSISSEDRQVIVHRMMQARQRLKRYLEEHPLKRRILDLSDMPIFEFKPYPLSIDLKRSIANLGLLMLLNILSFFIVHVTFLRYDVR